MSEVSLRQCPYLVPQMFFKNKNTNNSDNCGLITDTVNNLWVEFRLSLCRAETICQLIHNLINRKISIYL